MGLACGTFYGGDFSKSGTAFAAEFFFRLVGSATFWAGNDQRRTAIRAEFTPLPIIAPATRTTHRLTWSPGPRVAVIGTSQRP